MAIKPCSVARAPTELSVLELAPVHRLAYPLLRELSAGGFRSGEELAKHFGTSRSVVSNALKDAEREFGVRLFRLPHRGYRIEAPIEFIDQASVQAAWDAANVGLVLEVLDVATSTNSLMQTRAAAGAEAGLVLLAEHQTQGRGRLGRAWQSNLGGALTFSLLWRFRQGAGQLAGLSLAVAVAVLRGLAAAGVRGVQVKWPNDLVHADHKLGGILIETQGDMLGPSAAVIGIGLNVRMPDALKEQVGQPAVDLYSITTAVSRNQVFAEVLMALSRVLQEFAERGFAPFRAEWEAAHAYQGRTVVVTGIAGAPFEAVVRGVAPDGALIVTTRGVEMKLASAEISIRATA